MWCVLNLPHIMLVARERISCLWMLHTAIAEWYVPKHNNSTLRFISQFFILMQVMLLLFLVEWWSTRVILLFYYIAVVIILHSFSNGHGNDIFNFFFVLLFLFFWGKLKWISGYCLDYAFPFSMPWWKCIFILIEKLITDRSYFVQS